jgi:hypothetical protein
MRLHTAKRWVAYIFAEDCRTFRDLCDDEDWWLVGAVLASNTVFICFCTGLWMGVLTVSMHILNWLGWLPR